MPMENPLIGVFNRERTVLVFRQRPLEIYASYVGMAIGFASMGAALLGGALSNTLASSFVASVGQPMGLVFGFLFFGVSAWAYLMFTQLRFDLRKRTFTIRDRVGLAPRFQQGRIEEIRLLEVEPYSGLLPSTVHGPLIGARPALGETWVVRLHWNAPGRQPIVIEHLEINGAYGMRDAQLAGFGAKVRQYADALKVPVISKHPIPGLTRSP